MQDPEDEVVILAEGGAERLRELQAQLARGGIAGELLRPPPERCSS